MCAWLLDLPVFIVPSFAGDNVSSGFERDIREDCQDLVDVVDIYCIESRWSDVSRHFQGCIECPLSGWFLACVLLRGRRFTKVHGISCKIVLQLEAFILK